MWCSQAGAATVEPELAARLARETGPHRYPVILRLAQQPDPAQFAQKLQGVAQAQRGGRLLEALKAFNAPTQAPLLKELQTRRAEEVQPLDTVNAIAAHLGARIGLLDPDFDLVRLRAGHRGAECRGLARRLFQNLHRTGSGVDLPALEDRGAAGARERRVVEHALEIDACPGWSDFHCSR